MTVYTDEVNIYNTDAIAQGIQNAENAHKAYITDVSADNGIVVAAQGKGTVNGAITTATTGWHLADILEFVKQGVSRFWIGLKNQTDSTPTVRIGKEYVSGATDNESRMELDYHSLQLKDRENYTYFHVSDLREKLSNGTYAAALTDIFVGNGSTTEFDTRLPMLASNAVLGVWVDDVSISAFRQQDTDTVKVQTAPAVGAKVEIQYLTSSRFAKAYTFGIRKGPDTGSSDQQIIGAFSVAEGMACEAAGAYSHAEGISTHAIAYVSHAEGEKTTASGMDSHAEGSYSEASGGGSHAEGWHTSASGVQAHAEGEWTVASGIDSHAEGAYTEATDDMSHAEGFETEASGYASHAEGEGTHATGTRSHAQNNGTKAQYADQTAIGICNDNQPDNLFEIGNGTSDTARSNAFTVDWSGNTETAGHYYAEGLKVGHSWCYVSDINDTTMTAQNTSSSPHVYTLQVTGINQVKPTGAFTYDSSKKGVKAAVAGWYEVSIQVSSSNSASGDLIGVGIHRVRSGADASVAGPEYERCAGNYARISLSPTPIYLQKDDILYATVQNNSTGGKTINTCRWLIRPLIG